MKLHVEELDKGIRLIALEGRLDMAGAQEIDIKFTAHAASSKGLVLVDLAQVEFLASIGIRTLLSAAKGQKLRGGTLVMCAAQPLVAKAMETAGVTTIVPLLANREAGIAALQAANQ
jgi:anti-anti-sigma factor